VKDLQATRGLKMDGKQQAQRFFAQEHYRELDVEYDPEQGALWCYKRASSQSCCTPELFADMLHLYRRVEHSLRGDFENQKKDKLRYFIIASRVPSVFNLGGDLGLLLRLIRTNDLDGLHNYAKSCIDTLYTGYHLPITTISLVQGDAFGGGFEGALVSRVLIAERRAQMGLPETLFNFFPGMGAYSLLARKLGPTRAESLILSGRTYSAEELYDLGVVDVLAENGEGEKAVNTYIKKQNRANNSYQAIHKARQIFQPLNYNELMQISRLWMDAALQLSERDLRIMERFAQSQEKLVVLKPPVEVKQLA
jgi:DSF synthase